MKKLIVSREDLKNNISIIKKIANTAGQDEFTTKPRIIAVVKGNGMGLGLVEYSKFLVENGIDFLAVANVEEALSLRDAGVNQEILMLTPVLDKEEITLLIENNIILTISSKQQIEMTEKIATDLNCKVNAHIKIDTGFGRYGFLYSNLDEILEAYKMCKKVNISGTYTHFARPMDEKFTTQQFERFLDVVHFLKNEGQTTGILHCAESTAFLKYKIMHLNAVRIGSLFQGRTLVDVPDLVKIGRLKSSIQEIKVLPKGYNISYGNMCKTKRETKVAIVPVGFMDGLNMRKDRDIFSIKENILSVGIEIKKFFKDNNLKVIIKGQKYNIIGRIGMYHCVVDITNADNITTADEVEFEVPPMQVSSMIRREYE